MIILAQILAFILLGVACFLLGKHSGKNESFIYFNKLTLNGKYQKEWFKMFDLMDKVFTEEEKESMFIRFDNCKVEYFNIDFRDKRLRSRTTKRSFSIWLYKQMLKHSEGNQKEEK